MSTSRYNNYKAEDFAADSYFQKWIVEEDGMAVHFWERWLKENPHKEEEVKLAKEIIKSIRFKKYEATNEDFLEVWNNIMIQQTTRNFEKRSTFTPVWAGLAAACIALLLITVGFLFFHHKDKVSYSTSFNETSTLILPDSSTVILNSNSTISYKKEWQEERVVHLKGEAFFSVKHMPMHQKFIVYANDVKVEVLGTEFGVKYRRGKTRVVLQSGKVKFEVPKAKMKLWQINDKQTDEIIMEPGDLVEYSEKYQGLMKKEVTPEKYSAWTKDVLIFENTSLIEVANYIEDNYGYTVEIEEEEIGKKMFSGKINDKKNLDLLIQILQETFNLNIYKNETNLIIKIK